MGNACEDQTENRLQIINTYKHNNRTSRPQSDLSRSQFKKQITSKLSNILPDNVNSIQYGLGKMPDISQEIDQLLKKEFIQKPLKDSKFKGQEKPAQYIPQKRAYYAGQWSEGQPHGKGTAYYQNGSYFEGYFEQGQVNSQDCILVLPDLSYYRGAMIKSVFQGFGTFISASGTTYNGEWDRGVPEGQGEQTFPDGNSYAGTFKRGLKDGNGVFKWNDGKVYEGQFKNGKMHGRGKLTKGQELFQGYFEENKKTGKAELKTQFGTYDAYFKNGKIQGKGTFQWYDHTRFQGSFMDGLPDGRGVIKFIQGKTIEGEWQKGKNVRVIDIKSQARSRSRSRSSIRGTT